MSTGLKANPDGSAAIQVGGTDVITLTSGGAATFVTSPTTVQAGTAAAPSITTSGDTNTGIFFPAADTIAFAEGGVESVRFDSSGNVSIANGNLVISTSGKGIDFSATPGTGTSELLSDYEEGTWTPSVGGNATYIVGGQIGRYTRIGRIVIAEYILGINVIGTGSTTEISGLPFPINNTIQATGNLSYYQALAVNVLDLTAYGFNASTLRFYGRTTAGVTTSGPLGIFGNGAYIQGNLIYSV